MNSPRLHINLLTSLMLLTLGLVSCKEHNKVVSRTKVSFKKEGELKIFKSDDSIINLDIEIANTDYEIQTGLMYRDSMEQYQGMLFIFEDVTERYFYMKNTHIPLDIIYIDPNNKIVSFQKNAKPFDERSLPSNFPAKYVLEINAGLSDMWNLKVSDSIAYSTL